MSGRVGAEESGSERKGKRKRRERTSRTNPKRTPPKATNTPITIAGKALPGSSAGFLIRNPIAKKTC